MNRKEREEARDTLVRGYRKSDGNGGTTAAPPWVVRVVDAFISRCQNQDDVTILFSALRWCGAGAAPQRAEAILRACGDWPGNDLRALRAYVLDAHRCGAGRVSDRRRRARDTYVPTAYRDDSKIILSEVVEQKERFPSHNVVFPPHVLDGDAADFIDYVVREAVQTRPGAILYVHTRSGCSRVTVEPIARSEVSSVGIVPTEPFDPATGQRARELAEQAS